MKKKGEIRLHGAPICRGIAIGKPHFLKFPDDEIPEFSVPGSKIEKEVSRYMSAISKSKEDLKRLQKKLQKERIFEGEAILDAHLQIMQDPLLTDAVKRKIRQTKKNAEFAFHRTIHEYQQKFQSISNPVFRERFKDVQDISRRVLGYLRESVRVSLSSIPKNSIVFSNDLTASDAAEVNSGCAFVTTSGGATSHAAIVAKAKGIPYITGVKFDSLEPSYAENLVIVDGRKGEVIFSPSKESLDKYQKLQQCLSDEAALLTEARHHPCETKDGHPIKLSANIDMVDEIEAFHEHGGSGVGLFRSEYIFFSNDSFPTEEEQYQIYQKLIKKMNGFPIVIRTFDFGGDKQSFNSHLPFERTPFLGVRSIRFLLKERDIFKAQIRAILRSCKFGNVSIMFPMISSLPELLEAKEILEEAYYELLEKGMEKIEKIRVGCMIEVPSAVIISDLLAKECDFLSIGTNDLVQYSLAVDRRNHSASCLAAPTDPSVLRMIKLVVEAASAQNIPVNICGEMAADPRLTPLLIGLGVKEFSVSPRYIPFVKRVVRHSTMEQTQKLAATALKFTNALDVLELLSREYHKIVPHDRFYNEANC